MSEVTPDPAKTNTTNTTEPPKATKSAKKAEPKMQRVRSCVGRFVILHTNTVLGEGEEKKVLVDDWVQAQIDAKKLEVVTD